MQTPGKEALGTGGRFQLPALTRQCRIGKSPKLESQVCSLSPCCVSHAPLPEDAGWQLWHPSAGRGTPVLPAEESWVGMGKVSSPGQVHKASVMARAFGGAQGFFLEQ